MGNSKPGNQNKGLFELVLNCLLTGFSVELRKEIVQTFFKLTHGALKLEPLCWIEKHVVWYYFNNEFLSFRPFRVILYRNGESCDLLGFLFSLIWQTYDNKGVVCGWLPGTSFSKSKLKASVSNFQISTLSWGLKQSKPKGNSGSVRVQRCRYTRIRTQKKKKRKILAISEIKPPISVWPSQGVNRFPHGHEAASNAHGYSV